MPSVSHETNSSWEAYVNGSGNDTDVNSHVNRNDYPFQHLRKPQQDVLLLHGPGQKYTLHKAGQIPDLRSDREILIQVMAIGLNPVDWKGPDYNFGIPSLPWVNGRDFAGIVVKIEKSVTRVKTGDVVFGPSTDYRDVRKAAYQEYLVTTDFNVARLPEGLSVNTAAALGVAFVSAFFALGISLGFDFSNVEKGPSGPDIHAVLRSVNRETVPEDVHDETFHGINDDERPKAGDWFVIWGASSCTGLFAIQLAKLIGLRVIAVADAVRHGARLSELGVDFLVDRRDTSRAVEIIRSLTRGKLRFALDSVGKETATYLQESLQRSTEGRRSHLVGLTGLPKTKLPGVRYHNVPIKVFHNVEHVGEKVMGWLERLLIDKVLVLPTIALVDGGLEGINGALDKLRSGTISGKRLVVPIEIDRPEEVKPPDVKDCPSKAKENVDKLACADKFNKDPSRIKLAYWVPNVSGGLVISKTEQRTRWDLEANAEYAQTAERWGFEYALTQSRFMSGYGVENRDRKGQVKFAVNGFIIARETEEEAIRVLQEIQGKTDTGAVEAFRDQVKNAGASTSNKTGMWADSKFDDLVQYNDGFKTKLIGTSEQIAERILLIKSLGVDILLVAFLHNADDIQQFGEQVLSRARQLEAEGRGTDEEFEVRLTGDVYKARPKEEEG